MPAPRTDFEDSMSASALRGRNAGPIEWLNRQWPCRDRRRWAAMLPDHIHRGDIMRRPIVPPRSAAACVLRWCSGHRGLLAALALASVVLLPRTSLAASPLTITNPWFRYIMPEVPAGGYMTLNNASSQPLALIGASSAACGMLMLHRTETGGGIDWMVPVGKVTVPAHGTFRFAPGGYHIMCMRPAMHVGESVLVTLMFADGGKVQVRFPIYGVNGPPNAGAMGAKMKMLM